MFDKSLTIQVGLPRIRQIKVFHMKEKNISVREFLRRYRDIADEKKVYIISNHGHPEGVFVPYEEWTKANEPRKPFKLTKEDLEKIMFDGGDPNMSKNIDEILYGSN